MATHAGGGVPTSGGVGMGTSVHPFSSATTMASPTAPAASSPRWPVAAAAAAGASSGAGGSALVVQQAPGTVDLDAHLTQIKKSFEVRAHHGGTHHGGP